MYQHLKNHASEQRGTFIVARKPSNCFVWSWDFNSFLVQHDELLNVLNIFLGKK